jgi:hypothetical protein
MSIENGNKILFLLEDHNLFFMINELAKKNRITYCFSWVSDTHSAIDAILSNECKAIVVHAKFLDFFRQLRLISSSHVSIIVIYDIFSENIDFYAKECRADACIKIDNNQDFPYLLTQTILSAIEIDNITRLLRNFAFSTDRKVLGENDPKYQKKWIKHDVEKTQSLKEVHSELKKSFYSQKNIDPEQQSNTLIFKIRFPASHLNAGTLLINYISTLMSHKFNVSSPVTIKQEGLNITLMIDTQEGMREKVEQLIHDYVLFVRGDLPAERILGDPSHIQDLKNLLMIAQFQLQLKQGQHAPAEDNLKLLQDQVDQLTGILSASFRKSLDH